MIHKISTRDFNSLDIRFLRLYFWNSNSENTVLHRSLNLIHLRILRQPETPQELAIAALNTMPPREYMAHENLILYEYVLSLDPISLNIQFFSL
ncbi:hypothetical protein CFP56_002432 [Quercus suber]|uniref:Uncharacterized protein n=1 Tax=Quercus suber TaxID=58331 RepID=A0AAW0LFT9_QUESU